MQLEKKEVRDDSIGCLCYWHTCPPKGQYLCSVLIYTVVSVSQMDVVDL